MRIRQQTPKPPPCRAVEMYPFVVTFKKDERLTWSKEMMAWGNETYGPFVNKWAVSAPGNKVESAYFFSKADAMLFVLRWVGQ